MRESNPATLRIRCKNVGGIGTTTTKRQALFNSIRENVDITILSETKFKETEADTYRQEWNSQMYNSCTRENHAQAGVSILIRRGLDIKIGDKQGVGHGKDLNGRIVWVLAEIRAKTILIIGLYGPSSGDSEEFFRDELFPIMRDKNYDHCIIGGDWNVGMQAEDYKGYADPMGKRPKSRKAIHTGVETLDLIDIYREFQPDGRDFTWRNRGTISKKTGIATQQARLDYFMVDTGLAGLVQSVGPCEPFSKDYDHKSISMRIDMDKISYGRSYWKFNNTMLNDQGFLQKVDDEIAWSIWSNQEKNPGCASINLREISLMSKEERSQVKLQVNPHAFLECLLESIKSIARKHGREKKASLMKKKEGLELRIKAALDMERELNLRAERGELEESLMIDGLLLKGMVETLQGELKIINDHLNEGAYLRTGYNWKCESEAPTKIFLKQEQWRGQQRYIGILELEEGQNRPPRVIRTQPEVEEHISDFYTDLFRERATESSKDDIKNYLGEGFDILDGICQKNVDPTTMKEIDKPITKAEVLEAIQSGKAGRAPGFSGYTKEFYRHFAPDLIDFILKYIWYTEEQGILSTNQRLGIITLLPKGDKDKKSLKNWRPITLLSTLYKLISSVINNRFRRVLPKIIHQDQKGFVDGRYMGEVTRTIYDAIDDAHTHRKKGLIVAIDFEKAFDSVGHDFIKNVIEIAGFGKRLRKWIDILLNDFKSRVNHAGNLLREILLGRGARQGDPIATTLFVIAIEILLIRIRSDKDILPYRFFAGMGQNPIETKVDGYADDLTLLLPRIERALRAAMRAVENFYNISGLKLNRDKTQVLKIGHRAQNDAEICGDLGLTYVKELKILGVTFTPNPADMEINFVDKISEIETLLSRWNFRNITCFGRVELVKSLALSRLTHIVQVIPNPAGHLLDKLQSMISNFIWSGSQSKKKVVSAEIAMQPQEKGGLNVPDVRKFWDALKAAWAHRIVTAERDCKWANLCLQQTGRAIGRHSLSLEALLGTGTARLANSPCINPFWKNIYKSLDKATFHYYSNTPSSTGELLLYGNKCILEGGKPLDRRFYHPKITRQFNKVSDLINPITGNPFQIQDPEIDCLTQREVADWEKLMESVNSYLNQIKVGWDIVREALVGPTHLGWSRLALNGKKSKFYYNLLREEADTGERNSCEKKWRDKGAMFLSPQVWNRIYINFSKMKTNFRVKFQEWRIFWFRQELRKWKQYYALGENDKCPMCSYCKSEIEDEWHIYTQCSIINQFWDLAAQWFRSEIDKDLPRILLNNTKVFGFWNENPNDLSNIFLRSARYTIFKGRHIGVIPQVETLIPTVLDDLSKKYQKGRWKKYEGKPSEWRAIAFVRKRRGWSDVNPKWLPSE